MLMFDHERRIVGQRPGIDAFKIFKAGYIHLLWKFVQPNTLAIELLSFDVGGGFLWGPNVNFPPPVYTIIGEKP